MQMDLDEDTNQPIHFMTQAQDYGSQQMSQIDPASSHPPHYAHHDLNNSRLDSNAPTRHYSHRAAMIQI